MSPRWSPPTRLTWIGIAIAISVTLVTVASLWWIYPTLPYGVPVRFVEGIPLIYQRTTPMLVFLPAIVQVALLMIFGTLILLLLWRAEGRGLGRDSRASARLAADGRMTLAAEGIALLAAVWIGIQGLSAFRLVSLWRRGEGGFGDAYSIALITAIVASVVIGARTMKLVGLEHRSMAPVDPAVWRLRHLYFNPRDPALFAPKRTGVGWTLNFGRPLAILALAGTLVLGMGAPYILARLVLRLGD